MPNLKMPLLIRISMWIASLYTLWIIFLFVIAITGDAVGISSNIALDSILWLQLLGPLYLIKGSLLIAIVFGFYYHRAWSRHAVIILWIIAAVYALVLSAKVEYLRNQMQREMIQAGVLGIVSVLYFYFKRSVREYYKALEE
jgi:hypothetical protein